MAASALGAAVGLIGSITDSSHTRHAILLVSVLGYLGHNLVGFPKPLTSEWQVPQAWRQYGRTWYSFLFGSALGLGIITIVRTWGAYTLLAGCFVVADSTTGALLFGTFGFARGIPMLLTGMRYLATGYGRTGMLAKGALHPLMNGYTYVRAVQAVAVTSAGVSTVVLLWSAYGLK